MTVEVITFEKSYNHQSSSSSSSSSSSLSSSSSSSSADDHRPLRVRREFRSIGSNFPSRDRMAA
jgi:hypothetical protein